jgi:outer membrane murein-binding lipoprotein Lpp
MRLQKLFNMNMKCNHKVFTRVKISASLFLLCITGLGLWAQTNVLPLKRVVILTSGLAYFEHQGTVNGNLQLDLPFTVDAVNDALKTLVIIDPSSANPSVNYQSEQTLFQTLRSLKIDLSDDPGLAMILSKLKGAEIEITCPNPILGRIIGIEYRSAVISPIIQENEPWLLLSTKQGLQVFNFKEISSVSFKDNALNEDLNRAMDLIAESRNSNSRKLSLQLPASGSRNVTVSYVIPAPVWKVSYRLDLNTAKPVFQGWAIVDNDSDTDWNNVVLSLVAGRPVSFIQNLYPPYYVRRPVLPLSIAGTAQAASHDTGYSADALASFNLVRERAVSSAMIAEERMEMEAPRAKVSGGNIETAAGNMAGDQFEFTVKKPVSLDRRMSAMLPLVDASIEGQKLIIFTPGKGVHPRLGAELSNTTGMKLPAGPITVYDGVYAGDALIEFWNENEKRLISFGEALSVTAATADTNTRDVKTVAVSGGVMTISRSLTYVKTYTFKNTGTVSKQLIVEHPKTAQTTLVTPEASEQTASAYRFNLNLRASSELVFTVSEQRPISESITLLSLRPDSFLSYTTNQEIPQRIRTALQRAVDLRREINEAASTVKELEAQMTRLINDQDRIRRNIEAAGNQTSQGQEYLKRLTSLDSEIDNLSPEIEKARNSEKTAQKAFEDYLMGLNL